MKLKERNELTNSTSFQILIVVKPPTFIEDIISCFNQVITIWTTEIFLRKESQMIFSNQGIIGDSSHSSYI